MQGVVGARTRCGWMDLHKAGSGWAPQRAWQVERRVPCLCLCLVICYCDGRWRGTADCASWAMQQMFAGSTSSSLGIKVAWREGNVVEKGVKKRAKAVRKPLGPRRAKLWGLCQRKRQIFCGNLNSREFEGADVITVAKSSSIHAAVPPTPAPSHLSRRALLSPLCIRALAPASGRDGSGLGH